MTNRDETTQMLSHIFIKISWVALGLRPVFGETNLLHLLLYDENKTSTSQNTFSGSSPHIIAQRHRSNKSSVPPEDFAAGQFHKIIYFFPCQRLYRGDSIFWFLRLEYALFAQVLRVLAASYAAIMFFPACCNAVASLSRLSNFSFDIELYVENLAGNINRS